MNDAPTHPPPAIDAAATADDAEINALYRREAPRLLRFFGRRTGAGVDTADLVQETFLRFMRGMPARTVEKPTAYLHRIARNLLFDRTRYRGRRGAFLTPLPIDDVSLSVPPTQSHLIEASQMMDSYRQAVEALPPRTRQVFLLHRVDELSYKAIAEQLGISVRTVEWHITEALMRIRRILDET